MLLLSSWYKMEATFFTKVFVCICQTICVISPIDQSSTEKIVQWKIEAMEEIIHCITIESQWVEVVSVINMMILIIFHTFIFLSNTLIFTALQLCSCTKFHQNLINYLGEETCRSAGRHDLHTRIHTFNADISTVIRIIICFCHVQTCICIF
jgi:hypothetical protein